MTTATTAIQFIVSQIDAEAARRHVTLSDVEREMLRFREAPGLAASTIAAAETFERDYDADAYEQKIAGLLHSAYKRSTPTERPLWADAIERIMQGDWYLGVMLNQAGVYRPPGDRLRLWLTGCVAVGAALLIAGVLVPALREHFSEEQIGLYGWLVAIGSVALFTAARWVFGADAIDGVLNAVIDTLTFQRKRR